MQVHTVTLYMPKEEEKFWPYVCWRIILLPLLDHPTKRVAECNTKYAFDQLHGPCQRVRHGITSSNKDLVIRYAHIMLEKIPSCGTTISTAAIACLCYAACSTSLTLANKHIFSRELDYPWTLLSLQSILVVTILMIFQLLRNSRMISLNLMRQMLLPCLLFTIFIFSNSQALRFVSLPVLSVIKSLAPIGISLVERAMFGDTLSGGIAIAMLLIVVSNGVTMVNDMDYSANGYGWAFGNVLFNIAYVVSLRACLSDSFSPVQKAIHSNMIAATIMLPLSFVSGETLPFLQAIKETDNFFRFVYVVSCFLAAGIGTSVFWVVQTSSGSTLSFVGACNKVLVVILGGVLFRTRITPLGWFSVVLGVLAGAVFSMTKARESEGMKSTNQLNENGNDDEADIDNSVASKRYQNPDSHDVMDIDGEVDDDQVTERLV